MRIGKTDQPFTSIATSDAESVTIRGFDLCHELIGKLSFGELFWLLMLGQLPNSRQRAMLDACLIAIAEHGLVPTVQAARMTLAAAPEAWQGAMAAGLLGMGTVVAGSSEAAGRYLVELKQAADATGNEELAVEESLKRLKAARAKVAGLGHPQHTGGDPRAARLLELADEHAVSAQYVRLLRLLGKMAPSIMERRLPINVSGAIAAVMLDAGWPVEGLKAIPLVARAAGLAAHLHEETQRPIGFILSYHAAQAIQYDGPTRKE
ncbi:MAG: citryl-CoA lyase [Meiothermus sp.]|uniref:citryl-CoA lyase n=1 Tax=Meiothermus sp. TaxID=1955249 RepID=UPI0025E24C20|nr:citryl-CoA lyase [Meiothermus sp.]MCS7069058.1 citryl-CoA lyase [Meiothermus sp.]MCX7600674.1 citryl-CoA lyase [Meiothermus sp.]MDW8426314.1 citryl-CoA lyase [Meiothermus sp.]